MALFDDDFDSKFEAAVKIYEAKKAPVGLSLEDMKAAFKKMVMGQDEAIDDIVQYSFEKRRRKNKAKGCMGVYIFCGPSGVGKTELAKAFAKYFFNDENAIVNVECNRIEPNDKCIAWLGIERSFQNPQRGKIIETVMRNPNGCVINFDEFEKAAPNKDAVLAQAMLSIAEKGVIVSLFDDGQEIDVSKCIVIMTTNLKPAQLVALLETHKGKIDDVQEPAKDILSDVYAPEFFSRLDRVVIFRKPDKKTRTKIMLKELEGIGRDSGVTIKSITVGALQIVLEAQAKFEERTARDGRRVMERAFQRVLNDAASNDLTDVFLHHDGEKAYVFDINDEAHAYLLKQKTSADDEVAADEPQLIAPPTPKALSAPAVRHSPSIPLLQQEDEADDTEGTDAIERAPEEVYEEPPVVQKPRARRPFGLGGMSDDFDDVVAR